MARRRATFPEGIAEEEQRYAQVLRDIRDLRGETQQALGRLLGWSISTVSRFEAGTERPDEATHRRYCALASTDELRQRAMAAYKALPAPPVRQVAPARRSAEEWQGRALDGPGIYGFFEAKYPTYPALRLFGDEAKPLPVWVEPAASEQWTDVEAPLGFSISLIPLPMCVSGGTGSGAIPVQSDSSSGIWTSGTTNFARSRPASGCIWTPGTSSPTTRPT
jgi:transcriptional regulator with XRE-family HTH domain